MCLSVRYRLCLSWVFVLAIGSQAAAQGTETPSPGQSLEEELKAAPHPGQSGASLTLGAQLQDGRTSTRGWAVSGAGAHTTIHGHLLRLDGQANYGRYSGGPNEPTVLAEDNQRATFTYLHRLRPRVYLLGLGEWRRDAIIRLDYRAAAEAGVGVVVVEHARVQLFAGASFAVGREERKHRPDAERVRDLGLRQSLSVRLGEHALFQQSVRTHVEVGNADDRSSSLDLSLTSRLNRLAGLKVYYAHQYDALHPIDQAASQHKAGVGLQVTWPGRRAHSAVVP